VCGFPSFPSSLGPVLKSLSAIFAHNRCLAVADKSAARIAAVLELFRGSDPNSPAFNRLYARKNKKFHLTMVIARQSQLLPGLYKKTLSVDPRRAPAKQQANAAADCDKDQHQGKIVGHGVRPARRPGQILAHPQ